MTAALEGREWSAERPGRTLPPRKTRYPFYRRLGGPHGRSGRAENFVPTAGFEHRTFKPVAQWLYGLSYRVHTLCSHIKIKQMQFKCHCHHGESIFTIRRTPHRQKHHQQTSTTNLPANRQSNFINMLNNQYVKYHI